jgi:glutamate-1-semialdehyde 2,1-aminomutase
MVTFANTGTEATMEALRIARAVTGKDKLIKFEGHYHGHHDSVLFSVDSPSPVSGLESSPTRLAYFPGIPDEVSKTVIVAPWNNLTSLERILKKHSSDVAAIITEPVMANQGVIPPDPEYLKHLRELTIKYDVLLIFDEVLTGFRVARGGAQELYGVVPDLACFAKALGGGAPVAAVAGKREFMSMIGPGRIGFGGTYNANPLSLAASKATLQTLMENDGEAFRLMAANGAKLKEGLSSKIREAGYQAVVNNVGPLLSIYFTKLRKVSTYRQSAQSDQEKYKRFREEMVKRGVYMHPDGLERISLSAVHTEREIEETLTAAEESLKALRTHPVS